VTTGGAHAAACGRFAPSPTGPLHFGSLVAAVASHADARAARGRWLVRIEDVDAPRSQPGAAADIVATLARFGMVGDGPVVHQTTRVPLYDQAIAQLRARGVLYECACTRSELAGASAAADDGGERAYPGTCRHGIAGARADRAARALRVRVDDAVVTFVDRVQGPQRQVLADAVGDFTVRRSDGLTAYQLAVVVDDGAQHVTDVVRGADLLASTPRQVFLQRLLGLPEPRYLHVPVAVDARGEKLSKQTGARPLDHDTLAGLHAAWRFLGQLAPPRGAATVADFWAHAVSAWSPGRIPQAPTQRSPDAVA
jgi:glutamyl-Q tRNA(Asp) synthetase